MSAYKFVTRVVHAKTGEPLAIATHLNNTISVHTIVFSPEDLAHYTALTSPSLFGDTMFNVGYEVGRNAEVPMRAACGRTFISAAELAAEVRSNDPNYSGRLRSYMCTACAKRTTISTEPVQQEAVK